MIPALLKGAATVVKHSKIKVAENGRWAIIVNNEKLAHIVVQVDGKLIENATACDYVIAKPKVGDVCIELKGTDVDHAVEQVFETALFWQTNKLREGSIAALIICVRKPAFDTKIARFVQQFARKFNGPLHVHTKNDEFEFEKVLSFSGPK